MHKKSIKLDAIFTLEVVKMIEGQEMSVAQVCRDLRVHDANVIRELRYISQSLTLARPPNRVPLKCRLLTSALDE